jgi:hypothetical protein
MCLILKVHLAPSDVARAFEICRGANIPMDAERRKFFGFASRPSGVIEIPGPDGACGCSFLADSADWKAPTWDMISSTLPRLAGILRSIREHTSSGFSFEALWIGEQPAEECHVTIDELVQLALQGQLGTKTKYLVE